MYAPNSVVNHGGKRFSGSTLMKVVPGVFEMCDTYGLPLEDAIFTIDQRGYAVDWVGFIEDARKHGWTDKTIRRKVVYAVREIFDKDYLLEFMKRFDRFCD